MNNSWKEYKDRSEQIASDMEELYSDLDGENLDDMGDLGLLSDLGDAMNFFDGVLRTVRSKAS